MRTHRKLYGIWILFFVLTAHGTAQNNVLNPYNIFDLRHVVDVCVSPSGDNVAYIVTLPRSFSDAPGSDYRELYIKNLKTGAKIPAVTGKHTVRTLRWNPDGSKLGFLSSLDTLPGSQIYEIPASGGTPERITSNPTSISDFHYSPDGARIAFTATEPADPKIAEMKAKGFNAEIYEEEWQHRNLYMMDVQTKTAQKFTKNITVHNFDWHPDGSVIAAAVSMKNLTDYTYMFKRIYLIDTKNGLSERFIDNPGKLGDIKWSPNGKTLAFVSAVDVNDSKEGSIFVLTIDDYKAFTKLKNYNKDFEGTVTHIEWKDNTTLLYSAEEGVNTTIREQKLLSDERPLIVEGGKAAFHSFSLGGNTIAFNGSTPKHPMEVYTFDLSSKQLMQQTSHNEWLKNIRLARQEQFDYYAKDGTLVNGILIYPLGFDADKKDPEKKERRYPLIVTIHGGPESCYQNGWLTSYGNWAQMAAADDFFVFLPNYRASTGRGVAYAKEGFGDLVGKEFEDVLDGIDTLIAMHYVDQQRVGIGGGSYGGYFSAWAATKHSKRFAASCVFVGVSNQLSKRNTTDIPWEDYYVHWGYWTRDNWMDVLQRSPVFWTKGSITPTLILHGMEDPRIPPSQAVELYRCMEMEGDNPVRLVFYPGEGHGNRRNPARLDFALRTMQWFNYYLKGAIKKKHEIPEKELEIDLNRLH